MLVQCSELLCFSSFKLCGFGHAERFASEYHGSLNFAEFLFAPIVERARRRLYCSTLGVFG